MFTSYELIICVTLRATASGLALSGKKQKTIPPRSHSVQELRIFFSKLAQMSLGSRARQYTTHLISYMKNSVSCSYWKLSLIQFNTQKIRYAEKRFRSIFHVRRNLRISSTVSYFNILLSTIFQVCLLSNKEFFFQDMRYFSTSERTPVRITCNSRHTILSYYFELRGKIHLGTEKYRSKYGGSTYEKSLIIVC